jgi:ABC-type sugar transport system ATPase subunit
VTHDQVEALSMADRIAILNLGSLQQLGDPEEVYLLPENMFVAGILGNPSMNFLACSIQKRNGSIELVHSAFSIKSDGKGFRPLFRDRHEVMFGVRPEDISIYFEKPKGNSIEAQIYVTEPLGNKTIVDVKLGDDVVKVVTKASFIGKPEQRVWLRFKESKLHLFNGETGACVFHASEQTPLQVS